MKKIHCPKCKSTDIKDVNPIGYTFIQEPKFKCNDCGYEGIIYAKKIKNNKKNGR